MEQCIVIVDRGTRRVRMWFKPLVTHKGIGRRIEGRRLRRRSVGKEAYSVEFGFRMEFWFDLI